MILFEEAEQFPAEISAVSDRNEATDSLSTASGVFFTPTRCSPALRRAILHALGVRDVPCPEGNQDHAVHRQLHCRTRSGASSGYPSLSVDQDALKGQNFK